MGGYGSGWQGPRKATVEESLTLSASALVRKGVLVTGRHTSGQWWWAYEGEDPHAKIGYEANLLDLENAWLRLHYSANGEPVDYTVHLTWTRPHFGGVRWWLVCPLTNRRAAKLYLAPGTRRFAHRETHGLTYTSCRESGKFNALYGQLAASMGTDVATIRAVMRQ